MQNAFPLIRSLGVIGSVEVRPEHRDGPGENAITPSFEKWAILPKELQPLTAALNR